jgi:hypothetical protein
MSAQSPPRARPRPCAYAGPSLDEPRSISVCRSPLQHVPRPGGWSVLGLARPTSACADGPFTPSRLTLARENSARTCADAPILESVPRATPIPRAHRADGPDLGGFYETHMDESRSGSPDGPNALIVVVLPTPCRTPRSQADEPVTRKPVRLHLASWRRFRVRVDEPNPSAADPASAGVASACARMTQRSPSVSSPCCVAVPARRG